MLDKLRDFISSLPLNRNVLTIVGLFVILAAIPLTAYLSQQQQEIRQRAENNCIQNCGAEFAGREPSCNDILNQCDADSVFNSCKEGLRSACKTDCGDANVDCPSTCEQANIGTCNSERENQQNECNNAYNDCKSNSRTTYDSCVQNCPQPTPIPETGGGGAGYPCGQSNQTGIGVGVGQCNDGQGNTCTRYNRWEYRDQNGQDWCSDNGACNQPCAPTPTPGRGGGPTATPPPTCPQQTCSYTAADSSCPSGVAECFGNGVSGFNVPGCNYQGCLNKGGGIGGCTCVAAGGGVIATPTPQPGAITPTPRPPVPTVQPPVPTSGSLPTPRPTISIPTATPIPPTPTIPAGATSLVVSVRQQLVTNPRNNSRQLEVKIFNNQNQEIKSENVNAPFHNGIFTATLNLGNNFATGPYVVKVKIANTLRKLMQNITNIIAGQTNTLSAVELISGDLNNDNELSVVDYANLIGCVELPGKPVVCNNRSAADLNDDGNITIQDLGILISNFSHRKGD